MAQNQRKTFFLAPTRTSPPVGPIQLGDVITKPKWPEETRLNQTRGSIPLDSRVQVHKTHGWTLRGAKSRSAGGGVFVNFLADILGIGGEADATVGSAKANALTVDTLEVQTFQPSSAYVKQAMSEPAIQAVVRQKRLWLKHRHVYMVTGLQIARGVGTGLTQHLRQNELHAQVTANLTLLTGGTVPLAPGAKNDLAWKTAHQESFEASDDFVYAYRLSRIKPRPDGSYKVRPHYSGTQLDDHDADEEHVEEIMACLTYEVEEADAELDFDAEAQQMVDEHGNEIILAKPHDE